MHPDNVVERLISRASKVRETLTRHRLIVTGLQVTSCMCWRQPRRQASLAGNCWHALVAEKVRYKTVEMGFAVTLFFPIDMS